MKKSKIIYALWIVIVFLAFCSLYIAIHPMYMQSPDDWTYISYMRQAWIVPKSWNPARILQETLGGALGYISAFVIYPFLGDYVKSIAIIYGLACALAVTCYVFSLTKC